MINKQFLKTIKEYQMVAPGDRLLLAVSGGADSLALMNLFYECREELGIELQVGHLNHMIRKHDSELDARFVDLQAKKLNLPVVIESFNVADYAKEQKLNLEDAAREVRYEFLERIAKKTDCNKIALGHNADDNIETFLMRLLRGAGIKGLTGIPPKRGHIIRPLISIWRKDIDFYVGRLKLVPRTDYTNYESKYVRNRVRLKLIPQLKIYNLNIKEILMQTILLLTEDSLFLETKSREALKNVTQRQKDNSLVLNIHKLKRLDLPVRGHLLRMAIEKVKGDLRHLSYSHIHDILQKLDSTEAWELHLPDSIFAVGHANLLVLTRNKPSESPQKAFNYLLHVPGEINIPEAGMLISAKILDNLDDVDISSCPANEAYLDLSKISNDLIVRNKIDGDRFFPLGTGGSKKLQDFFVDERIPSVRRDQIPIVDSDGRIVWVAGMRISEKFKVTDKTKKVLHLKVEKVNA